jgi:predicted CopG family antitoxin
MTTIKTTITISEEVWEEFKRTVNLRYGGSRSLSQVVEEAIRIYNVVEMFWGSAGDLGVEIGGYPSSSEVEARRPTFPGSSARILREIRKE